ncbi:MAG: hypothetical protein EXS64_20100 [Candidatus Latescibacteria bacterium]|nr:hypothetical protein [Candidatus Latescibacterota bacterium]
METPEAGSDDAPESEQKRLTQRLGELINQLDHMEVKSLAEYYAKPRQVMFFNVILGICRGVGFAIGASVVGRPLPERRGQRPVPFRGRPLDRQAHRRHRPFYAGL